MTALIVVGIIIAYLIIAGIVYEVSEHNSPDEWADSHAIYAIFWPVLAPMAVGYLLAVAIMWVPRRITRRILK